MVAQISRQSIFDEWVEKEPSSRFDGVMKYVLKKLGIFDDLEKNSLNKLKMVVRTCLLQIELRWGKAQRHRDRFLRENATWLEKYIKLPDEVIQTAPCSSGTSNKGGRPIKNFVQCNPKVQVRKVKTLLQTHSQEELSKATELGLYKMGKRDSASIIREISVSSSQIGTKYKRAKKYLEQSVSKLTVDQALALLIDASLSSNQYQIIRSQAKQINCNIYPPYYKVKEAKRLCYPGDNILITEISAEVSVQALIDHTITRLCQALEEVFTTLSDINVLTFIVKWGCDGAQQARYKQSFKNENLTDESLFSISIVPIQIHYLSNQTKTIIWQNPAPSSTRYCRPIKFIFAKESKDLIESEVQKVQDQISKLSLTAVTIKGQIFNVNTSMIFCMIDGKVCNVVSHCASSTTCYLCGAKPHEMNKINILSQKIVDKTYLTFGLSPLHSWIRFFECLLHISYKMDIKKWQARGIENKIAVAEKKRTVQEKFRKKLGLLVDMPKQETGNTNDGNTARKFFRNAEISAEITGINLDLIKRFRVILESLNCGFPIDIDKFEKYTKETLDLYLKEYSWYLMPVSVHKVLFHGKDIIAASILPIGQLSEEAQEARNKDCRKYRELFTRKTSRLDTNTDLFYRLLISSDPFITSIRVCNHRQMKRDNITPEVLFLLKGPPLEPNQGISDSDSE